MMTRQAYASFSPQTCSSDVGRYIRLYFARDMVFDAAKPILLTK